MKKHSLTLSTLFAFGTPLFTHAQDIFFLVEDAGSLIRFATPILVGLALLAFFWGLVKFIWGGGENRDQGKNIMIWGVIALFVMVSIWGIVRFIQRSLGVDPINTVAPPFI